MEVVIAVVLFIVAAVIFGIHRSWGLLCLAAGLAVLYLEAAFKQF